MKPRMSPKNVNVILRDALVLIGGAAIVAGCWLAYAPAGLVVGGLALGFLGIAGEMEQQRRRDEEARRRREGL